MSYWVIRIADYHPDIPGAYWCGYVGKTHIWKQGREGFDQAIRFCRGVDAAKAGVSGPNTPYQLAEALPNRGSRVEEITSNLPQEVKP